MPVEARYVWYCTFDSKFSLILFQFYLALAGQVGRLRPRERSGAAGTRGGEYLVLTGGGEYLTGRRR